MIERIRTILNREDISASKLAEKLGVQRSSISHILSERNKPSLEFVQKLIEAFPSINPIWILTGKEKYTKSNAVTNTPTKEEHTTNIKKINTEEPEKTPLPQKHTPPIPPIENSLFSEIKKGTKKKTIKVITFYNDGTFDEFTPNN